MIHFGIAGLIVAFIIFAELRSIRQLMNQHFKNVEYEDDYIHQINHSKIALKEHNEALTEMINHFSKKHKELSQEDIEILSHARYVASQYKSE